MTLFAGGFQAVFGAAFAPLYADGTLHKTTLADDGADGFTGSTVDWPAKVLVQSLSDQDRAAAGLPRTAVRLSVLAAGLPVRIEIDDSMTAGGATYRVVLVETDAAGVSFTLNGVPA